MQHVFDKSGQMVVVPVQVLRILGGLDAGEDQNQVIAFDIRHFGAEIMPQHAVGVLGGEVIKVVNLHIRQGAAQAGGCPHIPVR